MSSESSVREGRGKGSVKAPAKGSDTTNKAKGALKEVEKLWNKHVGWKGGALIRTLFACLMFHWYGETAVIGVLVAFFAPHVVQNVQPHFETAISKAQQAPLWVWPLIAGILGAIYMFEGKESHYFESVMTIINLACYIVAAQVGADLATRNIARAQTSGGVQTKFG